MAAVLGLSAFYHDSAAAIVVDGRIVAAAQEERFTRVRHDASFPARSIAYCLAAAGLAADQLDLAVYYEKPLLKFGRILEMSLAAAPWGLSSFIDSMSQWLTGKFRMDRLLRSGPLEPYTRRFLYSEHHLSHAASAFYPSPFEEAAILTIDGVGEWATATCGPGRGNRVEVLQELRFPHSLGLLYSAFTTFCGFKVNSGEYKLMGLAPYGSPVYADAIREHLIDLKDDGSFRLDLSYFDFWHGRRMPSRKFEELFGGPPHVPETPLTQRECDLAASIQVVTEEIVLKMAEHLHRRTGLRNACLAGGVALNCVANGRLLRDGPFEQVWFQPAAGDAGGALGAALFVAHQLLGEKRVVTADDCADPGRCSGRHLETTKSNRCCERTARSTSVAIPTSISVRCRRAARDREGRWLVSGPHGVRPPGPRIAEHSWRRPQPANAGSDEPEDQVPRIVSPVRAVVLEEHAADYWDCRPGDVGPYMMTVMPLREERRQSTRSNGLGCVNEVRSDIPAVTHVDYSARIQTVDANGMADSTSC